MNHQRTNNPYAKVTRPKGESQSSSEPKKAASTTQQRAPSSAGQWKSTFQPADEAAPQDYTSQDTSTSNPQRVELYDPYTPLSSESEPEVGQGAERHHRRSPQNDMDLWRRWEMGHSQPEETQSGGGGERRDRSSEWQDRSAERQDRSAETRDRSAERPDRSAERPDRSAERPDLSAERRDRSGEWQGRSDERPDRSAERPDRSAERPDLSTERRDRSGEWQGRSDERPDRSAERPDRSAEKPDRSAERPDRSAEKPDRSAERRDRSGEWQGRSDERPDRSAERPDRSAEKPDRSAERPDRIGEWQDRSAERPNRSAERPDRSAERPDRSGEWRDRSAERPDRSGEWPDRSGERRDRSGEWPDQSAERRDRSGEWQDRSGEWPDRSAERPDRRAERHLIPSGSHQHLHQPHQASSPGVQRNYDQLWPARPDERSSSERHSLGEERVLGPPMNTEFATSVGLTTANLPADYQLQTGYGETGAIPTVNTNMAPPREVPGSSIGFTTVDMEKQSTFSCELCEVKYARLEALQEHLESRSHWDMMEHIQVLNNYDDLTIAFLQEVMMFKVRRASHATVEQDTEALKETDYLSRVDMLHCSVCNVYISTHATSVKSHVGSAKHHQNKQAFCYRQKRQCLEKAAVMMDLLKPQFQQYREGGNPFE